MTGPTGANINIIISLILLAVFVVAHHILFVLIGIKRKSIKGYIFAAVALVAVYMGIKVYQDQHFMHRMLSTVTESVSILPGGGPSDINELPGRMGPSNGLPGDAGPGGGSSGIGETSKAGHFNREKFIMDLLIVLLLAAFDATFTLLEQYRKKEAAQLKLRDREQQADKTLYIRADRKYIKIEPETISYIKGMNEYIQFHFVSDRDPILVHKTMKQCLEILPDNFVQVQKSYIVNMNFVTSVETGRVVLDDETAIPIGESYRKGLNEHLRWHKGIPARGTEQPTPDDN